MRPFSNVVDPTPFAKGTRPMLELAAQSIARVSGVAETMVDVLHGRAFKHYAAVLRQYLGARLGDSPAADATLGELRAVAAAKGADELTRPPGVRANLFALARQLWMKRAETLAGSPSQRRTSLPWHVPRGQGPSYADLLRTLRSAMSEDEGELLELRFARELAPVEIALVVGRGEEDVTNNLAAAFQAAKRALGSSAPDRGSALERMLLEAWALELPIGSVRVDEPDEHEPLAASLVIGGRYEIELRVGSGSFADVYRAKDTDVPGHVVALKLLHQASRSEEAKQAALRELHIIASVFHPSIVQFKDHGWHESRLWFVMPWYEGETLEARIQREPLSRLEGRQIFEPLARALATMHSVGIRHQDVKPDNIFLAKLPGFDLGGGVLPVLLDLGVAAKEAEMVVAGTPTYFAPEVAAQFASVPKPHPIGAKADVFSLALSLRNSLDPYTADDVAAGAVETFIEHRATDPPDAPASRDLAFLKPSFETWLSLDPNERPTAEELAEELHVLTLPEDRRARTVRLLRWLGPLLLTLGVCFAAVVYVLDREARVKELEAAQARQEAAETRDDLMAESAARRALERDISEVQESYQQSKLTRAQLADTLDRTESDYRIARTSLDAERRRTRQLREELGAANETNTQLTANLAAARDELAHTQTALASERARTADFTTQVASLRTELGEARSESERERQRIAQLEGQLSTAEGELAAEEARSGTLERRLATAEADAARAEAAVTASERRIAQLERQLAEARRPATPTPPGAAEEAPAPTPTPPP